MAMTQGPLVVIGFAQAFAAIETAWSLQRAGMRVLAFGRRGARSALARVRGVEIREITPPEVSAAAAQRELESLLEARRPEAVMPLDDSSLWLVDRTDLAGGIRIGPDAAGVAIALDKHAQVNAARAAGFMVPETLLVPDAGSLRDLTWPAVVKPAHAVRLEGDRLVRGRGAICADRAELEAARPILGAGPWLCQPYLTGVGEGIFGYTEAGRPVRLSAHRRVRMVNPHGSASSACESMEVERESEGRVRKLLAAAAWSGMFMVELLRDVDGVPWFMELNGRPWGSLALARRRGLEYPAWAVESALGLPPSSIAPPTPPQLRARHLGREMAHVLFVLRGPRSSAVQSWPSRRTTLAAVLSVQRGDRVYNWDRRQPAVLAADTWLTLAELVRGRARSK